ncbi:hypothetical protein OS493_017236 [Desmophyllum pertusum]|uniref:Uncharacterized protein n=1 Tax=Desmophyllum pertusum TaxID=174260 RepID=A0A9X0D8S4_9CNID|nr:hypothetical protein OS493_017236 [Desmophyllum pertusum]
MGVWLCAHPRGVAVSTPRGVAGCPQRCVAASSQSRGCVPAKMTGGVFTEVWLWAHKEMWLCAHKRDVAVCFPGTWQCATQGITLQIALVALELKLRATLRWGWKLGVVVR